MYGVAHVCVCLYSVMSCGRVGSSSCAQAVAHVELLAQHARRSGDEEADEETRERACGQVLCHAYCLYVTQLTSGMRLGTCGGVTFRVL